MSKKEKKLIIISSILAIVLVVIAYSYQLGTASNQEPEDSGNNDSTEELVVGEPESTHAHMSFVMLIDGQIYNFNRDKYIEESEYTHFHEGDPFTIHKHATGVSLPYFLETLGFDVTEDCVVLDEGDEYCNDEEKRWTMVVNGSIIEEPSKYELRHGDRILFNYGSNSKIEIRTMGQVDVPAVPEELMKDAFNIHGD